MLALSRAPCRRSRGGRYERLQVEAAETERALVDRYEVAMEACREVVTKLPPTLTGLPQVADDVEAAVADLEAQMQAEAEAAAARVERELLERADLQTRYDWLLVRWSGREPRAQDVAMMAKLQEELSRQMHMTADAVQAAREYKEALRNNDSAYTRLFGQGTLRPDDYVAKHNELAAQLAAGAPPAGPRHLQRAAGSYEPPPSPSTSAPPVPSPRRGRAVTSRISAPIVLPLTSARPFSARAAANSGLLPPPSAHLPTATAGRTSRVLNAQQDHMCNHSFGIKSAKQAYDCSTETTIASDAFRQTAPSYSMDAAAALAHSAKMGAQRPWTAQGVAKADPPTGAQDHPVALDLRPKSMQQQLRPTRQMGTPLHE